MKTLTMVILASLCTMAAHASGTTIGNGGGAWACFSSTNELKWIRLVDLYEAKEEFKLQIPTKNSHFSYNDIIDLVNARLLRALPEFSIDLIKYQNQVRSSIIFIDADLRLVDDSLFRIIPSTNECLDGKIQYVQLANYTNYGKVLIQNTTWINPQLSETDKAALIFHEAIYSYLRERAGETNSIRARQAVGYIFSDIDDQQLSSILKNIFLPSGTIPPTTTQPVEPPPQKYFEPGKFYDLNRQSGYASALTKGILVLDGNPQDGWTIETGVWGNNNFKDSSLTIKLDRKIGKLTWAGDANVTVSFENEIKCIYPVSIRVTFGMDSYKDYRDTDYFSTAIVESYYPSIYSLSNECRDSLSKDSVFSRGKTIL